MVLNYIQNILPLDQALRHVIRNETAFGFSQIDDNKTSFLPVDLLRSQDTVYNILTP